MWGVHKATIHDCIFRAIPFLYNELKSDGYDFPGSGGATTAPSKVRFFVVFLPSSVSVPCTFQKNISADEAKETDDLAKGKTWFSRSGYRSNQFLLQLFYYR